MKIFRKSRKDLLLGLCPRCAEAALAELTECERALSEFDRRVDAALALPALSRTTKCFLKKQWYGEPSGALSLGNRAVQAAAFMATVRVTLKLAHNDPNARAGKRRLRMLTTAPDAGMTPANSPRVCASAVCGSFYKAAKAAGMDALGFIDVTQIKDVDLLNPPTLAAHMHGIVRGQDQRFVVRAALARCTPKRDATNCAGLPIVNIRSKGSNQGNGLSRKDVAHLAYYVRKPSCGFKIVKTISHQRETIGTLHGWGIKPALLQLECFSHLDALKTTVGVGQGKRWRADWKSEMLRLLRYETRCRGAVIDHPRLTKAWRRLWDELDTEQGALVLL